MEWDIRELFLAPAVGFLISCWHIFENKVSTGDLHRSLHTLSPSSPSGANHQSAEAWRAPAAGATCSMTFKAWGFPAGSYILHELSGAERRRGELCSPGSPRQLQVTAGLIHGPSFPWMQARKRLSCLFHPSSPSSLTASVHTSPLCQTLAKCLAGVQAWERRPGAHPAHPMPLGLSPSCEGAQETSVPLQHRGICCRAKGMSPSPAL